MVKNYRAELVGVFGNPIDENPTGVVEEAAFRKLQLNYRYITMRVYEHDLEDAIKGIKAMNFRGINLTIPHKVKVLQYLDELSEAATIIGAVNVIVNNEGTLFGENTDGKGFLMALNNADVSVKNKKIVVLGAGGAAKAIAVECALAGAAHITIINRDQSRGLDLTNLIKNKTAVASGFIIWDHAISISPDSDILINATSVGLYPKVHIKPNLNYDSIQQEMVVSDVIFNDPNSLFLKETAHRGAKTINGLGMLAKQAELNFKLWTGEEAPLGLMEQVLKEEFELE